MYITRPNHSMQTGAAMRQVDRKFYVSLHVADKRNIFHIDLLCNKCVCLFVFPKKVRKFMAHLNRKWNEVFTYSTDGAGIFFSLLSFSNFKFFQLQASM